MTFNLNKANQQANALIATQKVKLISYIGFFVIGFVIASVVLMMIQSVLALNAQLVTAISIVIGAYSAVYKFIKHEHRALSATEINQLTLGSIGIVWLLTTLYFLALWLLIFDVFNREVFVEMARQQPLPLLFALTLVILLTLLGARLSIWAMNLLLAPKE